MLVLVIALLLWLFAGWKWALCVLLPALAVELTLWATQWRNLRKGGN